MEVDQGPPKFNPETGLYKRVGEGSRRGGQEVERKRDKGQERERGEQERNREEEQEPTLKRKCICHCQPCLEMMVEERKRI